VPFLRVRVRRTVSSTCAVASRARIHGSFGVVCSNVPPVLARVREKSRTRTQAELHTAGTERCTVSQSFMLLVLHCAGLGLRRRVAGGPRPPRVLPSAEKVHAWLALSLSATVCVQTCQSYSAASCLCFFRPCSLSTSLPVRCSHAQQQETPSSLVPPRRAP
jgi:hypothetical protein